MTQPGLLDRVRAEIRNRRFSYRTGQAYGLWIRKFIHINGINAAGAVMFQSSPDHLNPTPGFCARIAIE